VLLSMKRRCRKRVAMIHAMCASRPCLSGRRCCLARRVIAMAVEAVLLLRRSVRSDGQVGGGGGGLQYYCMANLWDPTINEHPKNSIPWGP
jgi:hypothetical protein